MTVSRRIITCSVAPALLAGVILAMLPADRRAATILLNVSPSLPLGLYRRVRAPVRPGALIAFAVPKSGRAYTRDHMPDRLRTSILKPVAAGPGAQICVQADQLTIDSRAVAIIASRDHQGRHLPHWEGCRVLAEGEVFTLSTRISNSFDSRYFGPVGRADILGVYAPLMVFQGASGRAAQR